MATQPTGIRVHEVYCVYRKPGAVHLIPAGTKMSSAMTSLLPAAFSPITCQVSSILKSDRGTRQQTCLKLPSVWVSLPPSSAHAT
jgi:hypothetical protein